MCLRRMPGHGQARGRPKRKASRGVQEAVQRLARSRSPSSPVQTRDPSPAGVPASASTQGLGVQAGEVQSLQEILRQEILRQTGPLMLQLQAKWDAGAAAKLYHNTAAAARSFYQRAASTSAISASSLTTHPRPSTAQQSGGGVSGDTYRTYRCACGCPCSGQHTTA
jgi:hypothetical protein